MSNKKSMDGNMAAAHVGYSMSDCCLLFPITPSSNMGENADEFSAKGRKNIFGQVVNITQMQSEAGVAGAVHGALAAGALTTTFTASQGLLLMIPNMFKIAGEIMPCVFHVSARAVAGQALSIFGDNSDVMAARMTGFNQISSGNIQEVMDLGTITHLASLESSLPFIHFFDGFRLSHEVQKIEVLDYDTIRSMVNMEKVHEFRMKQLNPEFPSMRGSAQGPDVYMQMVERANPYYNKVADIVEDVMMRFEKKIGRSYHLFDYVGHPEAEYVIVMMTSAAAVAEEMVKYFLKQGKKYGVLKVRLFRPFSPKHMLAALPKTMKLCTVLDRTKEPGSVGEPLFTDVASVLFESGVYKDVKICGGRFGLGSKEFTPMMVKSVFDNMESPKMRNRFTVGIEDDLTGISLPVDGWTSDRADMEIIDIIPKTTKQCIFWGLGGDGTVGANKDAIKIVGDNTDNYAQAYFGYDAHKTLGVTSSYLRFGPEPINSPYLIYNADYIGCHKATYVNSINVAENIKNGGIFVLNSAWSTVEDIEAHLPNKMLKHMANRDVQIYNVNAVKIANSIGLGGRINMIMQAVFFNLSGVLPYDLAVKLLKEAIKKTFGRKGDRIVNMNYKAVDAAEDAIVKIEYSKEKWLALPDDIAVDNSKLPQYINDVLKPMARMEGDKIKVSSLPAAGISPLGTTKYERRAVSDILPIWDAETCTQCNSCSTICPHATIRPFILDDKEKENAPGTFKTVPGRKPKTAKYHYRIQVAPEDCTGCYLCRAFCPTNSISYIRRDDYPFEDELKNWEYARDTVEEKEEIINFDTTEFSQFKTPHLEFSGACSGCSQTPVVKLLTQMYGDRMMIANATGCSSIWGAYMPSFPFTKNKEGKGPAWANSLFEDNAEFGVGMEIAQDMQRKDMFRLAEEEIEKEGVNEELKESLKKLVEHFDDAGATKEAAAEISKYLDAHRDVVEKDETLGKIDKSRYNMVKKSYWIVGGDGWAYDIGYGGVDHVLNMERDVNILVLDTEVYSNTGGQKSKATPMGGVAKFAYAGKDTKKKDLGLLALMQGNVYVCSISLHANPEHALKCLKEAEEFKGPSLILYYGPCAMHNITGGMLKSIMQCKIAVDTGYWMLYSFNPNLKKEGKNPLTIESFKPSLPVSDFVKSENRFQALKRMDEKLYNKYLNGLQKDVEDRYQQYKSLESLMSEEGVVKKQQIDFDGLIAVVYGSQTGNAKSVAINVASNLNNDGFGAASIAAAEFDLAKEHTKIQGLIVITSTVGDGEFPDNMKGFWNALKSAEENAYAGLQFAVFGLGCRQYKKYQVSAKQIDEKLAALGATRFHETGFGDDDDEGGFMKGFAVWEDTLTEKVEKIAEKGKGQVVDLDIEDIPGLCNWEKKGVKFVKSSALLSNDPFLNQIVETKLLSKFVYSFRVMCPDIAAYCRPGQFVIVRADEKGERIPLTIADYSPEEGWIHLVVQNVGFSSAKICNFKQGQKFMDILGPLGEVSEIENFGTVVCVAGGVGIAPMHPIARELKKKGNKVISIIGARNKDLLFWSDKMTDLSDEIVITTDDGSFGQKGFVTDALKAIIEKEKIDRVITIGPPIMMKMVSKMTMEPKIKTICSLNTIMVDGTGMCGGCRITYGDETKFVCADGPEFDAHLVDWETMKMRMAAYTEFEDEKKVLKGRDPPRLKIKSNKRVPMPEQDGHYRGTNFNEVNIGYTVEMAMAEAARCKQCADAPCSKGCPVQVDIKGFIGLIQQGKFIEAWEMIKTTNAYPAICGRVCPQENQCEGRCTLLTEDNKEPVAIGHLERFVSDYAAEFKAPQTVIKNKKETRVAIVGAGPSGMICAADLAQMGYKVTVYEALHTAGGVLVYGIPEFRLPKQIVVRECLDVKELGVNFVFNYPVGSGASLPQLMERENYEASFIGTGAGLPYFMGIPGEECSGVYSSNEFLTRVNLMKAYDPNYQTPVLRSQRVGVIGGGNVAMDAARCAYRIGAEKVYIIYRRTRNEMPARVEEVKHAVEEGIELETLCAPIKINGDERKFVKSIELQRMVLGEPDDSGRRRPVPIPGDTFELELDQIVVAIGQGPNPLLTKNWPELELNKRGHIPVDDNMMTNIPGVFAGGDIVTGAATVIEAMGAGKDAAVGIDKYLTAKNAEEKKEE